MHTAIPSSHSSKAHKNSSPYHAGARLSGRLCFCIHIKQEANSRAQTGQNSRACIGQNSRAQIASRSFLYLAFYASRRIKASPLYASRRISHYCERFSIARCANLAAGTVCQFGTGTRTPVLCANPGLAHGVVPLCVHAHRRIMRTILNKLVENDSHYQED